jgi:hypothetical protein
MQGWKTICSKYYGNGTHPAIKAGLQRPGRKVVWCKRALATSENDLYEVGIEH